MPGTRGTCTSAGPNWLVRRAGLFLRHRAAHRTDPLDGLAVRHCAGACRVVDAAQHAAVSVVCHRPPRLLRLPSRAEGPWPGQQRSPWRVASPCGDRAPARARPLPALLAPSVDPVRRRTTPRSAPRRARPPPAAQTGVPNRGAAPRNSRRRDLCVTQHSMPQCRRRPGPLPSLDCGPQQSVHGGAMDATLSPTPLLPALIETYLARCAVEGKSPRTIHAYRESLARFSRCLQEDGAPLDPDRLRPDHVIAYFVRFADHAALIPATATSARCAASAPGCTPLAIPTTTPSAASATSACPTTIVPPLAPAEIARLIACCDAATAMGRRDRAILLTLLDTGIRCAEAVGLDLADCALTERRLLVRQGKGGKDRIVPFAGRCGRRARCLSRRPGDGARPALRRRPLRAPQRRRASPAERAQATAATAQPGRGRPDGSTRIASATRSPPGPSPTTRASSMSSTCSATAPRRWCAATAPPTAAPRPPSATPPSPPATACSRGRPSPLGPSGPATPSSRAACTGLSSMATLASGARKTRHFSFGGTSVNLRGTS